MDFLNKSPQLAKAIRMFGTHTFETANTLSKPIAKALMERMRSTQPGDLVFEVTTACRSSDESHLDAVGYLISQTDDETYIRTLDGRDEHWRGALFHAIPGVNSFDDENQEPLLDYLPPLQSLARTIRVFGGNAHLVSIFCNGPSLKLYQRMKRPAIGDLVIERAVSFRVSESDHIDAVGYLLEQGDVVGWDWKERFTRISTLDGREMRWINTSFLALPSERTIAEWVFAN
jgi:hypothetical protein